MIGIGMMLIKLDDMESNPYHERMEVKYEQYY